jgi:hypothetical protein
MERWRDECASIGKILVRRFERTKNDGQRMRTREDREQQKSSGASAIQWRFLWCQNFTKRKIAYRSEYSSILHRIANTTLSNTTKIHNCHGDGTSWSRWCITFTWKSIWLSKVVFMLHQLCHPVSPLHMMRAAKNTIQRCAQENMTDAGDCNSSQRHSLSLRRSSGCS